MAACKHQIVILFFAIFTIGLSNSSLSQQATGRVVINEYLAWPGNSCPVNSEFVELLNFGPGPVDISCFVLTDGDYSITIPAGTILQPKQFYVISGISRIDKPCANIDSAITVDLNWNTCGCTSGPIPNTGGGWLTDGGSASEQLVLLNATGKVVDAVVRTTPEPSRQILSSANSRCTPLDFNLDTMTINYEVLGMSQGRGNSFARKLDGDCSWVKDPQQSANATNNTSGDATDIVYIFNIVESQDCTGAQGKVQITVERSDLSDIFPMSWSLVEDIDKDGEFTLADKYTYGEELNPPSILINGLFRGRYRLVIASAKGCYLKTFHFTILPCSNVLPLKLEYFQLQKQTLNHLFFDWKINEVENLYSVVVERSKDRINFVAESDYHAAGSEGTKIFTHSTSIKSGYRYYRLKITGLDGRTTYSGIINTEENHSLARVWPNPASDLIQVEINANSRQRHAYRIVNSSGVLVQQGQITVEPGRNVIPLTVSRLPQGTYQLVISKNGEQPISYRFVKQ